MKQTLRLFPALLLLAAGAQAQVPAITGQPVIVEPDLLAWPDEFPTETPNLSEPTSNRLADFHGEFADCDVAFSTAGNYHMALRELWQIYLHNYVDDLNVRNWFYTTSPPISPEQVQTGVVQFGNLKARCRPQVAVGPGDIMTALRAIPGATVGTPVQIIKNYGNVILVKKGNPKHIRTVWDLGKPNVTVVTPNPIEGGSYRNFTGTIYNIAANDPNPPDGQTATELFNSIFNTPNDASFHDEGDHGESHHRPKWVAGKRIMHREIPWAIYSGKADAGVIFYHLALLAVRNFPDQFEIVPLGGTWDNPQPLPGNQVGVMSAIRIAGPWTANQLEAQERLMDALKSTEFTEILSRHGLRRP